MKAKWNSAASEELYGVRGWGDGFFAVGSDGSLVVRPSGHEDGVTVSMMTLVKGLADRGLDMPVLLRFADILDARITRLNESFRRAIRDADYQGAYRGVYPIKVNQQQQVVEEILRFGRKYHYGLETGSKAELIAALAHLEDPEALLICNGYKDEEFIDLALQGLKMGFRVFLVIEMPGELALVVDRAKRLGVRPCLGVRAKLVAEGGGHWNGSGGDRSPFGLNASQVIDLVDRLRDLEMMDCLQMLHFHLGSQIPNIRSIRTGVAEAARFYVDLAREGAAMGYFDLGGGLAVDYDGSHTDSPSSSNYTMDEYAADIVEIILAETTKAGVPHPTLVTEAGRAVVAHHSVLLFNILDVTHMNPPGMPESLPADAHVLLHSMIEVNNAIGTSNLQECYHDALHYRDEIRSLFEYGQVSLRQRALAERMFWHITSRISRASRQLKYVPDELDELEQTMADVYHGNFSVFQSLPDSWAIDQLFPIMPIHRLKELPSRNATLADLTCDCDGAISRFIDMRDVRRTLPLHEATTGEYYLGAFLVGAYQETLGDLHNLLGDTNVVGVRVDPDGSISYDCEISGDTVADVLSYVEYNPHTLVERMRRTAEAAVRRGQITATDRRKIMTAYEDGLRGYTYFEQ